MGQSLVKNYIHIIFSTKDREQLILEPHETGLHNILGTICKNHDCQPITIGGYTDHVHILCTLSKKIMLITLLEKVKGQSSKWMKTQDESLMNFYWQDGYGAFSVSPRDVEKVSAYIANQHEHHSKQSFQDEYRGILKRYNAEYDERYVWD